MGYGRTAAIDGSYDGLLVGADILHEQCSVGPNFGIGSGM
jgi:hypothetical protein